MRKWEEIKKGVVVLMIKELNLQNFTVFKNTEITFCDGINIIIGENGTGKTHLLKILYSFCECDAKNPDGLLALSDFARKLMNCFQIKDLTKLLRNPTVIVQKKESIKINITTGENNCSFVISPTGLGDSPWVIEGSGEVNKVVIPSVFIPAKEMLTHSRIEKDFLFRDLPFDITLIDILNKAGVSTVKSLPEGMLKVLDRIAGVIDGKVVYKNDRYYVEKPDGVLIEFAVEAEGFKKLGLIYRLIETGYLKEGSVLIWDEPEANLNPQLIPFLVDILLALEITGVQMILATHNYLLARYFELRKHTANQLLFYSLYKSNGSVLVENNYAFIDLEDNSISNAYDKLLDDVFEDIVSEE